MYKITTSNVTVMVKDMDKAVNFYTAIGLSLKQRWQNHYAQVEAPGVVIGLHPAKETRDNGGGVSIGFGVDDVAPVKIKLDEMKVKYDLSEDKAGHFVSLSDPDGTPLYFMQSKVGNW